MSAHTPGPWRTDGWVPTWAYIPVKDARHNVVCSMYPDSGRGYTSEQVEANARLIAAAPEMYAELEKLVESSPFEPAANGIKVYLTFAQIERQRAALSKARGAQS